MKDIGLTNTFHQRNQIGLDSAYKSGTKLSIKDDTMFVAGTSNLQDAWDDLKVPLGLTKFSQRYQDVNKLESMFENIELRSQCEDNRQSSTEIINPSITYGGLEAEASTQIEKHLEVVHELYNNLLEAGVAREQARMILPLTTTTKIQMTGSIRSWIHFLELRDDGHAQKEIQTIAKSIKKQLKEHLPIITEALDF
jgi:thymidylate synthase (FAD)